MTLEKRSFELELRSFDDRIAGYAAVFYDGTPKTEYELGNNIVERCDPDCFKRLIQGDGDVIVSVNHDFNSILGRRSANTLDLKVDKTGLHWSVPYDAEDPDHVRVKRKIAKGELRGCSFAFRALKDSWKLEGNKHVRTLLDVEVIELGPAPIPKYTGAFITSRSHNCDTALESLKLHESQLLASSLLALKKFE